MSPGRLPAHRIAPATRRRYSRTVQLPDLTSPDCYLFGFEGDQAVLLAMDRAAYRRSIFLDDRISPASEAPAFAAIADLPAPGPAPETGWIFHVAHCGSTLLARALDRSDGGLVLREPFALRQLGVEAASGAASEAGWQGRLDLAVALLARRYPGAPPTIIKANVPANFMLPALLPDPAAPAVLLYFPLADYLAAVLRSDGHRNWVRRVTAELAPAIAGLVGPIPASDAECAAALWLAQLRNFATVQSQYRNAWSLDAEALFTIPQPVIVAASALFGQGISATDAAEIANGALFSSYAKNPAAAFDNAARLARRAALAATLAAEIATARRWVEARLPQYPLPSQLDRPLPGTAARALLG